MSVHFIVGKPGGGKSLYAMRLLADELQHGTRPIVTNLSVKLDELNVRYQGCDAVARVRTITEEQCRRFWLCRGGSDVPVVRSREHLDGKPDFSQSVATGGVLYVIDEVHLFYNAREWAKVGQEAIWYLSQHRKMGDDIICISQAVEQVDVQFRRLALDFTYVTNYKQRKLLGFQMPPLFHRATFAGMVKGPTDKPMLHGVFRLDPEGLASCYDTAAGVGIVGREADRKARRGGLPWWMLPAGLVGVGCLAWAVPVLGAKWGISKARSMLPGPAAAVAPATPAPSAPSPPPFTIQTAKAIVLPATNLWVTAMVGSPPDCMICLSDGKTVRATSPRIRAIEPGEWVILDGQRVTFQR